MEPIDRAAIMGALTSSEGQAAIKAMTGAEAYNYFLALLCSVPAIDAAPVAHGRWIKHDGYTECSKCEYWYDSAESEDAGDRSNYCPNCGARMDGGEGHEAD